MGKIAESLPEAMPVNSLFFRKNSALSGSYHCHVWNEIGDGEVWSKFYRKPGKEWHSGKTCDVIEVTLLPFMNSGKRLDVSDPPVAGLLPFTEAGCSPYISNAEEMESLMKKINQVLNDDDLEVSRCPFISLSLFSGSGLRF